MSSPNMEREFQRAAKALEPLAEHGVAIAQAVLGALHHGPLLGDQKDEAKARRYLERAAKQGDAPSILPFARTAPGGSCGNIDWLEKAAAGGEPWGHWEIANCHVRGRIKNPDLAIAESAAHAYAAETIRQRGNLSAAENLYADLERALGRKVERPFPASAR